MVSNPKSSRVAGTKAVGRALRIARTFTDARPEWTLASLSRELGLSKPTALRLLAALEREGIVRVMMPRAPTGSGPRPSSWALGPNAPTASPAPRVPEMESLTRATGETSSIEILSGDETVILDEVQGGHLIGTSPSVGTRWPAHATSTGKVLLAAALEREPDLIRALTQTDRRQARRLTPCTIVHRRRLTAELGRVSRAGYSTARSASWRKATWRVGAPVRNHEGQVVAAVSLGGPSTRFTDCRLPRLVKLVREAGRTDLPAPRVYRPGFSTRDTVPRSMRFSLLLPSGTILRARRDCVGVLPAIATPENRLPSPRARSSSSAAAREPTP